MGGTRLRWRGAIKSLIGRHKGRKSSSEEVEEGGGESVIGPVVLYSGNSVLHRNKQTNKHPNSEVTPPSLNYYYPAPSPTVMLSREGDVSKRIGSILPFVSVFPLLSMSLIPHIDPALTACRGPSQSDT